MGINYDCDTVIASYRSKASKQEKELFRIDSLHLREDPKKAWALIQPYLNHPGFFELGRWNCCRRVEDKDTIGCQMDVVRHHVGKLKMHRSAIWSRTTVPGLVAVEDEMQMAAKMEHWTHQYSLKIIAIMAYAEEKKTLTIVRVGSGGNDIF